MRLIPDWRRAWRWFSVQTLAILAVLPMVWAQMPPEIKAYVPATWGWAVFMFIALGGIAGRLIDQKPKA